MENPPQKSLSDEFPSQKFSLQTLNMDLFLYLLSFITEMKLNYDEEKEEISLEEKEEIDHKGLRWCYSQLASVDRRFNTFFKTAANAERDNLLARLLRDIVQGRPMKVNATLEKYPWLILYESTVKDYAGYTITATPYRAALCCQDPQMTELIQKHMIAHVGPEETLKQWKAQFPRGWERAELKRWQPLFKQLRVLDKVIRQFSEVSISMQDQDKVAVIEDSKVAREYEKFMLFLEATRNDPIKTGRTFNPQFMQKVARILDERIADDRNNYLNASPFFVCPKHLKFELAFCWQRVFGVTQCFVSSADAASFIDSLDTVKLRTNQPQNRLMKIKDDRLREYSMFPQDGGLGVAYAIYPEWRIGPFPGYPSNKFNDDWMLHKHWNIYIMQKQLLFNQLYRDLYKKSCLHNMRCALM